MNYGKFPLNTRNIIKKIYQYNQNIKSNKSNNFIINERNDSFKEKNKS